MSRRPPRPNSPVRAGSDIRTSKTTVGAAFRSDRPAHAQAAEHERSRDEGGPVDEYDNGKQRRRARSAPRASARTAPRGVPGLREPAARLLASRRRDTQTTTSSCACRAADDIDELAPAFADPELREAGNLPELDRDELLATLPYLARARGGWPAAAGRRRGGARLGTCSAARRSITSTRSEGSSSSATGCSRTRAAAGWRPELHACSQSTPSRSVSSAWRRTSMSAIAPSERVLERAGFSREGVIRSLPKPDGRRVDKTLSLASARRVTVE